MSRPSRQTKLPRQAKLPRRGAARAGEMNLEAAAEERIDAITAEPLEGTRFIEILSPDKTLRLFYNVSTLVRIANDKGGFMQPPHFREPMHPSLITRIEEMEGKRFRFDKRDIFVPSQGGVDDVDAGGAEGRMSSTGLLIQHRHVYFEQIIDEFYHLNPAEVYVCPVCFEHYVHTRYAPYREHSGRPIATLEDGSTTVVDPLDVLCYMLGGAVDVDEVEMATSPAENTPLAHIVFRRAADWKRHMSLHHDVSTVPAGDYRLRDVLCTFHSNYNLLQEQRHVARVKRYGDAPRRPTLTQQRYWQLNARYNCLRYNRVVEAAERAAEHPNVVSETAFPGETIAAELNPAVEDDGDSDFVVADEDVSSDDGGGGLPRFEGASSDSATSSSSSSDSSGDAEDEMETAKPRGKRKREGSGSPSAEETVSDGSTSNDSSTTDKDDDDDSSSDESADSDAAVRSSIERQRQLFRRGLLKETDCYYQRLSAEDRRFMAAAARRTYTPSRLYDPILARRPGQPEPTTRPEDDVDWAEIGEELTPATARTRAEPADTGARASGVAVTPAGLLLDEDDEGAEGGAREVPVAAKATGQPVGVHKTERAGSAATPDKPPAAVRPQPVRFLLDDEE